MQVGVVPGVIFYFPDDTGTDPDRPLLRFAICKRRDTIEEAVRRIREMEFPAPGQALEGRKEASGSGTT